MWAQVGWRSWAEDPGMAPPEPMEAGSWPGWGGERKVWRGLWGLWLMGRGRPFLPGSLSRRGTGGAGWGLGGQEGGGRRDGGWWTD